MKFRLMWLWAAAVMFFAGISANGVACAADFGQDDSGTFKFTMTSIPFLDNAKEGSEECSSSGSASDYDDAEYTVDSIGRKVPVRTHRSGSAISTR